MSAASAAGEESSVLKVAPGHHDASKHEDQTTDSTLSRGGVVMDKEASVHEKTKEAAATAEEKTIRHRSPLPTKDALEVLGLAFGDILKSAAPTPIVYFKPHGCVCWGLGSSWHSPFMVPTEHMLNKIIPKNGFVFRGGVFYPSAIGQFKGFGMGGAGDNCGGLLGGAKSGADALGAFNIPGGTAAFAALKALASGRNAQDLPGGRSSLSHERAGGRVNGDGGGEGPLQARCADKSGSGGLGNSVGSGLGDAGGLGMGTTLASGRPGGPGGGRVHLGLGACQLGALQATGIHDEASRAFQGLTVGGGGVLQGALGSLLQLEGGVTFGAGLGQVGLSQGLLSREDLQKLSTAQLPEVASATQGGFRGAFSSSVHSNQLIGSGQMAQSGMTEDPFSFEKAAALAKGELPSYAEPRAASSGATRSRLRKLKRIQAALKSGRIAMPGVADTLAAIQAASRSAAAKATEGKDGEGKGGGAKGGGGPGGKAAGGKIDVKKVEVKKGKVPPKKPPAKAPPKAPPKKKVVENLAAKSGKRLRKIPWDPLYEKENTTFEAAIDLNLSLDPEKVELDFNLAPAKAPDGGEVKPKAKKAEVIKLLPDAKRSYNMSIATARISKIGFDKLRQAVQMLDPAILDADTCQTLIEYAPKPEEIKALQSYIGGGGDIAKTDKSEQFVHAMMNVKNMRERLEAHQFALSFSSELDDLFTPVEKLQKASESLREATKLPSVLYMITRLGNALNGTEVKGIRLSTFPKLLEMKTTTRPSRNVLQYIVDIAYSSPAKELLDMTEELKPSSEASKLDIAGVEQRISAFAGQLKKVATQVDKMIQAGDVIVEDALGPFVQQAQAQLQQLDKALNDAKAAFSETAAYYGESEATLKKTSVSAFFGYASKFGREIATIVKDKEEKLQREAKRKAKESAAVKKTQKKTVPKEAAPKKIKMRTAETDEAGASSLKVSAPNENTPSKDQVLVDKVASIL